MKKLEKIVRTKDKYRKKYDYNYGKGSFDRSNLAKFNKKQVNVSGTVVDFSFENSRPTYFRAVIYDVNVEGVFVDHLNIEVPERFYLTILESYMKEIPIRFTGVVHKYSFGVRRTYGISKIRKVRLKTSKDTVISSLQYYRSYSQDYRISDKIAMKEYDRGINLKVLTSNGFNTSFKKNVLLKIYPDSLLSYFHERYTKISKADDTLSNFYGKGNQLRKHHYLLQNKGTKRGVYSKYIAMSHLSKYKYCFNKVHDLYKDGVKNIRLFLYDWVEDKESGFKSSIKFLPYVTDLSSYLSVPIVAQDVSNPDRYCIVYTSKRGVTSNEMYKKFIEKIMKDFGVSTGEITYYDPYRNIFTVRKAINGSLILSKEDIQKNK